MRRIGYRSQRTLAGTAEVRGIGFITGTKVRLRFHPAPPDTGIAFVRSDLPNRPLIPARPDKVSGTNRRTTLGPSETGVTLVEHVLASLAGSRIDNCVVELDGPEPPGLDGSALGFIEAITSVGVYHQGARRPIWTVTEPLVISHGGATIALHPTNSHEPTTLQASYILDYGISAPIPRQAHTLGVSPEAFSREIASCRTFLLEPEAVSLWDKGIGRHLTPAQVLVFGSRGIIDNKLRYADEPARHKLLDIIGDLALCGFDLAGHLVAYRSGHSLNVALARNLVTQVNNGLLPEVVVSSPARPALTTRRRATAA